MKKLLVIFALFTLVFLFSSAIERVQKSAGPPSCHSGEPPNNTNCTSCHDDGIANTGSAIVSLDLGGADVNYIPGKTYTITVSVSKEGMHRAGFQSIALQDNNNKISPGTFTLTDENRTQILDKNTPHSGGCLEEERVWVEHTYAGISSNDSGISRWSYQWTTPTVNVGAITFYLAALEANNDLSETGDHVYTVKKTIEGLPVGINESQAANLFVIYPLPATHVLNIKYTNQLPDEITLHSTAGKLIKVWNHQKMNDSQDIITLSTIDIPSGIYLIKLKGRFGTVVKKVFIQ